MTGNLGKFSTEPAADGWRDKDEKARERMREMRQSKIETEGAREGEREIHREEKSQTGDKRREVDVGRVQGRAQTTRHGSSRAPGARQ